MSNRFSEFSAEDLQDINRRTIERLQAQSAAAAALDVALIKAHDNVSKAAAAAAEAEAAANSIGHSVTGMFHNVLAHVRGKSVATATGTLADTIANSSIKGIVRFSRDDLRHALILASEKVK